MGNNTSRHMDLRNATPEEIREDLGLHLDATSAEVYGERERLFNLSKEIVAAEVQVEGVDNAAQEN